jgi:recombination protein RecT
MSQKNENKQVQEKEENQQVAVFKQELAKYQKSIINLLKAYGMSSDKFLVTIYNSVKRTPKLLECKSDSLFGAILTSAELGLEPNTPQGFAYIIPYEQEAQFQLGYMGVLELLYRNNKVKSVEAEVVYENDKFEFKKGLNSTLDHVPATGDRGKPIYVYAIVKMDNADPIFTVMSEDDVMKIKKISQAASSKYSPWNSGSDPFHWMWKKTAIKQVAKLVPKMLDLHKALSIDDAIETGGSIKTNKDGEVIIEENPNAKKNIRSAKENNELDDLLKKQSQNTEYNEQSLKETEGQRIAREEQKQKDSKKKQNSNSDRLFYE